MKRNALIVLAALLLLSGCTRDESGLTGRETADHTVTGMEEEKRLSEVNMAQYMELFAEELKPVVTEEKFRELEQMNWDDTIRPYMMYDWIHDARIEKMMAKESGWTMQLADLNLDGQPEMLITTFSFNKEDFTDIFTIKDGEVVYCGKIIAGSNYQDNQQFIEEARYLPSYYIDVYQNESGEFRYLSCDAFLMADHGYYQIYESEWDGESIFCKPVFAIGFSADGEGHMHYQYTTGKWSDRESEFEDSADYTAFCQEMETYMRGYEKIDVSFATSEYHVPALAGELPEEQQEIVRNNIIAGFAQALGYLDTEKEEQ